MKRFKYDSPNVLSSEVEMGGMRLLTTSGDVDMRDGGEFFQEVVWLKRQLP